MIRTLVVDDEPPARRRLCDLLRDEPDVQVVGECGTAAQALDAVRAHRPDLVFLDVRMPGGDGFVLAEHTGVDGPLIVMVSAFSQHALQAFDVQALDYLMKPFSRERLARSLDRVRTGLAGLSPPSAAPLRRLPVDVGRRIRLLDVTAIDCLRADGNYVRVHAGEFYLIRDALGNLCTRLDPTEFARVHRSAAVRVDQIREAETLPHGEYVLRLASGCSVISGRRYREAVRVALGLS
jgi:two-component system LytT family response regulator